MAQNATGLSPAPKTNSGARKRSVRRNVQTSAPSRNSGFNRASILCISSSRTTTTSALRNARNGSRRFPAGSRRIVKIFRRHQHECPPHAPTADAESHRRADAPLLYPQHCHPERRRWTCCSPVAPRLSARCPATNLSAPTHTGTPARCAISKGSSPKPSRIIAFH